MVDLSKLSHAALKAAMAGGTEEWGRRGSAIDHVRYAEPIVSRKGRLRCCCGCRRPSTHMGMANGMALTRGCKMQVRRWIRDPRQLSRVTPLPNL